MALQDICIYTLECEMKESDTGNADQPPKDVATEEQPRQIAMADYSDLVIANNVKRKILKSSKTRAAMIESGVMLYAASM